MRTSLQDAGTSPPVPAGQTQCVLFTPGELRQGSCGLHFPPAKGKEWKGLFCKARGQVCAGTTTGSLRGRRLPPGSKGDSLFHSLLARARLPPAAFPDSLWLPGSLCLFGKGLGQAQVAERKTGILLCLRAGVEEGVSAKSRHLREFQGGAQNSHPQLEASWNNNTVSSFKELSYTLSHSGRQQSCRAGIIILLRKGCGRPSDL